MPDSYGHAKDFFELGLDDGDFNKKRSLLQYSNPSKSKPRKDDLIVYSKTVFNQYGHVSIVSEVVGEKVEIIQQNPGPFSNSREIYDLIYTEDDGKWKIKNDRIIGWLRKPN